MTTPVPDEPPQARQPQEQRARVPLAALAAVRAGRVVVALDEGDGARDLLLEFVEMAVQRRADVVVEALVVQVSVGEVAREERLPDPFDAPEHGVARRQHQPSVGAGTVERRRGDTLVDHRRERRPVRRVAPWQVHSSTIADVRASAQAWPTATR